MREEAPLEEYTRKELERLIAESRRTHRDSLVVLSDEAIFVFFKVDNGKLGLGYVESADGAGFGGAIGPNFASDEECLAWLKREREKYQVRGKLEIVKRSGEEAPANAEIRGLLSKRVLKVLTTEDRQVIESVFVGKYAFQSFTIRQVGRRAGIPYERVKKVCERLERLGCVLIWYPTKEMLHITARGWDVLEMKK